MLPQFAFLIVAIVLDALEIPARNHPNDPSVTDQGNMAEPAVPHDSQGVDRTLLRRNRDRIGCHDVGESGGGRIAAFGDDAADHIAASEDSGKATVVIDDDD